MGDGFSPLNDNRKDQLQKLIHTSPSTQMIKLENTNIRLLQRLQVINEDLDRSRLQGKNYKKELHIQTFFLENILEKMEEGVIFIDLEGTILLCNNNALKQINKNRQELIHQSFWDHFSDHFFGFSLRSTLFYGLVPENSQLTLRPQVELEVSCQQSKDPFPLKGLFIYIKEVGLANGIKRREEQEEQFVQLGKMTANLSHEMRNQLGGIRGFSALLMRDLEDLPHLQEMASQVLESSKNLEYYLTSSLNFSRKVQLSCTYTNMNAFLKESIEFFKRDPACPEKIKFDMHLPFESIFTMLDPAYFRSSLLNLLLNGIEAMEDEGCITLSLMRQNDYLIISISDTGIGMKDGEIEKIFSPYFTTKEKGNGIGLVEVEKIIHAHGGRIEVRSQETMGTTFSIFLPIKQDVVK